MAIAWQAGGRVFAADTGEVVRDDPDDPMRTALRQVVGVFAELDRRMVVKRLREGRAAKASTGCKVTGSYPYGYAGAGKGRDRDAAPRTDEQRAVARIVELRQAGKSYRAIAAHARRRRPPAPPGRIVVSHGGTRRRPARAERGSRVRLKGHPGDPE